MPDNTKEKLFTALTKEVGYYLNDLPREAFDRAKHHIWVTATFLGGVWIFIQASKLLGFSDQVRNNVLILFCFVVIVTLLLVSLFFSLKGSSAKQLQTPNHEFILKLFEEPKAGASSSHEGDLLTRWMKHLVEITNANHIVHEARMKDIKISYWFLVGALAFAALIPLLMLCSLFGGSHG